MPGTRQNEARTAPSAAAIARCCKISSLSRLNVRRQAASPIPLAWKKVSRMSSLSMTGRFSAGPNRRASVLFPLAGKPEITMNGLRIGGRAALPALLSSLFSPRGAHPRERALRRSRTRYPRAGRRRCLRASRQSMRTTPGLTVGNRANTAGSWPGMTSLGENANDSIRCCAATLAFRSSVCAIAIPFSRFSKR
jgi:hypothetical protein